MKRYSKFIDQKMLLRWQWKRKLLVVSDSLQPHRINNPGDSPGQNPGVGSPSLLQGITPTQESNRGLLHCRGILYQLSHKGSPLALSLFIYILAALCNLQDLRSPTRDQTWSTASTEYLTTCPPGNSLLAGLKSVNTSETLEQCWIHSNSNCEWL